MTELTNSILIDAPTEKVFHYVSDYKKWPAFYKGLSDVEPVTKTTQGNGAKFIYTVKLLGFKFAVGTEFTNFKENKGWIGKSFKGMEHKTAWRFKALNDQTEFTHSVTYKYPWYMGGKFFDKTFVKPQWEKIIEESLHKLKEIMERE